MPRTPLRATAIAFLFAVTAAAGLGAPLAYADPGDQGSVDGASQQAPNPALIDPDATVQLSITKYLGAPTGAANDGTSLATDAPTLPTLKGVDFEVYRVYTDEERAEEVDLTTNEGWAAASAITGYTPTAADFTAGTFTVADTPYYLQVSPTTVTTDGSGVARFTQANGVGLYLVREDVQAGDVVTNNVDAATIPVNQITPAAPFFVTLPMTNPTTRNTWMYDVYVYPKNQRDTIAKVVADQGTVTTETDATYGNAADHAYTYTLRSSITAGNTPLGMYVIYDDLHPSLTFRGAGVALGGTALQPGDYTVHTAPGWGREATLFTGGTVSEGPVVAIVLTNAGLTKLQGKRDEEVVTTIDVTMGPRDDDGIVENTASFIPNAGWWASNGTTGVDPENPGGGLPATETGNASETVVTRFGDLVIDKHDAQGGAKLAGAVFGIYRDANEDGQCKPGEMTAANLIGMTAATGNDGGARFSGLQTSDFYDGATKSNPITYCLVETTAPKQYNLDAAPRAFTILHRTDNGLPTTTVAVPNAESNLGNELPLTGGPGVAVISVIGALLILGGIGYYIVSRQRDEPRGPAHP